jgi:hypothetical protein
LNEIIGCDGHLFYFLKNFDAEILSFATNQRAFFRKCTWQCAQTKPYGYNQSGSL